MTAEIVKINKHYHCTEIKPNSVAWPFVTLKIHVTSTVTTPPPLPAHLIFTNIYAMSQFALFEHYIAELHEYYFGS